MPSDRDSLIVVSILLPFPKKNAAINKPKAFAISPIKKPMIISFLIIKIPRIKSLNTVVRR